eukprot:6201810-Pleurochrysis_carterae.AAC.4
MRIETGVRIEFGSGSRRLVWSIAHSLASTSSQPCACARVRRVQVMAERICPSDWMDEEVGNLAREGLRTLVVAAKALSDAQYAHFERAMKTAQLAKTNRAEAVRRPSHARSGQSVAFAKPSRRCSASIWGGGGK